MIVRSNTRDESAEDGYDSGLTSPSAEEHQHTLSHQSVEETRGDVGEDCLQRV